MSDFSSSSSDSSFESTNYFDDSFDDMMELLEDTEDEDIEDEDIEYEDFVKDVVNEYTESEFQEKFRVSRKVANDLANLYNTDDLFKSKEDELEDGLSAFEEILIFLWFAGHDLITLEKIGERFGVTNIKNLNDIIKRVAHFISYLSSNVMKSPTTQEKIVSELSFKKNGFPGAIGAIASHHIKIKIDLREEDAETYLNKKHFYSIHLLLMCDHAKKIQGFLIGYNGSAHDTTVFNSCSLSTQLADVCGDYYLLGDKGFPCSRNLLTPFTDNGNLTKTERNFNNLLSVNRSIVDECFSALQCKFSRLYNLEIIPSTEGLHVHFVRACCVLYNLSLHDTCDDEMDICFDDNVDTDDEAVSFRNYVAHNILK